MPLDKLDAEYFKRLIEKAIATHDGTVPVNQLYDEDYEKWDGVNVQQQAQDPPKPEEETLALYIIDADGKLSKRFTVTKALLCLVGRGTMRIAYGTTAPDGRQTKMILQWEKEKRIPVQKLPDGMERTTHVKEAKR